MALDRAEVFVVLESRLLQKRPLECESSPNAPIDDDVNQVAGTYSGGVLALEIAYETVDATMLLTLTTF